MHFRTPRTRPARLHQHYRLCHTRCPCGRYFSTACCGCSGCYESSFRGGKRFRLRPSFADQLGGVGGCFRRGPHKLGFGAARSTPGETSFWRNGTPMMPMMPGAGGGGGDVQRQVKTLAHLRPLPAPPPHPPVRPPPPLGAQVIRLLCVAGRHNCLA